MKGAAGFYAVEGRGLVGAVHYRVVAKRADFAQKRMEVCEQGRNDPHPYPELREAHGREREER